jgi:hypothetical protein
MALSYFMLFSASIGFYLILWFAWYIFYLNIASLYDAVQIARETAYLHAQTLSAQSAAIRSRVQPESIGVALSRIALKISSADKQDAQDLIFLLAARLRLSVDGSDGGASIEKYCSGHLNIDAADQKIMLRVPRNVGAFISTFMFVNGAAWTCLFIIFLGGHSTYYLSSDGIGGELRMVSFWSVFCAVGFVSSYFCYYLWKILFAKMDIIRGSLYFYIVIIFVAYGSAAMPGVIYHFVLRHVGFSLGEYASYGFYYVCIFSSLLCVCHYTRSLQSELAQRVLLARAAEAAASARNSMLRYQVRPHFLFNALNALHTLVIDAQWGRAHEMCRALSAYVEQSFAEDGRDFVPVAEQADALGAYLSIEAVRFGERLRYRAEIPDDLAQARAPALILHPLVENAMKYAVATSADPVDVEIEARRDGDDLVLAVRDSGGDPQAPSRPGLGIGLSNVRARLAGHYGERGMLNCEPLKPKGFVAEIRLPLEFAWTPSAA